MKAPEKLYLHPTEKGKVGANWLTFPLTNEDIEYTCTDAFIEKACEWIKTNMDDYIYVEYDNVTGMPTIETHIAYKKVVEDFKKYMKGE